MKQKSNSLQDDLVAWYRTMRRDLPWRKTHDPYAIWVSEVMLQQTRVDTVVPYWHRFLTSFPTVVALAEAPIDHVLTAWSGLGYYRRARMLHRAAQQICDDFGGAFPSNAEGLRQLHGVGAYTAGAIASIAFNERAALVDGNVVRVLSRLFALTEDVRGGSGLARIWQVAGELVPAEHPGDWNQALMELGATVCVPREPRCLACPVRPHCAGRRAGIERTLPVLKAKPKPTHVRHIALVARGHEGAILLARRKPEGTFGGMWEPPTLVVEGRDVDDFELQKAAFDALATPRLAVVGLSPIGKVVHVLSHRRMEVQVFAGSLSRRRRSFLVNSTVYDMLALVLPTALADRGLTTYARKVLNIEERAGARTTMSASKSLSFLHR